MKVGHLLLHNVILMCLIVMNRSIESVSSFIQIHDRSLSENKKIEGIMNIDGESYNTVCDCDPISTEKLDKKRKCIPNSLQIIAERDGQVANYDEIKILIGDVKELNFVKISATSFKCLDGRNNIGVLGTPGGDAGEFLLALSVYENLLGQAINLSQNDVDVILTAYLNKLPFEKLYMCTDDMAISHLERELSVTIYLYV